MYKELNKHLDEQKQLADQTLNADMEVSAKKELNETQLTETTSLQDTIHKNANLLFKGVKSVPMEEIQKNLTTEEQNRLDELKRQEEEASFKERRAIRKERSSIYEAIGTRMKENVEQLIDMSIERTLKAETGAGPGQAEAERKDRVLNPALFGDTVSRLKFSVSTDYRKSKEMRENILERLDVSSESLSRFQKRYGRTQYAVRVLGKKMDHKSRKYLQNRMKQMDAEKEQVDKTLYQYDSPLASDTSMKRFRQRANHLYQSSRAAAERAVKDGKPAPPALTMEQAEKEILRRGLEPATLRNLKAIGEEFKNIKRVSNGKTAEKSIYTENLERIVESFNRAVIEHNATREKDEPEVAQLDVETAEKYITDYLNEIKENSDLCFRCSADTFGLIADDKMKTQMETRTSGGLNNQAVRKGFTARKFGCTPDDLDDTEYENYGYLGSKNAFIDTYSFTSQYGMISVRLNKESMKDRVSCVFGDSLDTQAGTQPCPLSDISAICCNKVAQTVLLQMAHGRYVMKDKEKISADPVISILKANELIRDRDLYNKKEADTRPPSYFELQFHGDVTVRDMEEVTISISRNRFKLKEKAPDGKDQYVDETDEAMDKRKADAVKKVMAKIKDINEHPEKYGRLGMEPLKLNVMDQREVLAKTAAKKEAG